MYHNKEVINLTPAIQDIKPTDDRQDFTIEGWVYPDKPPEIKHTGIESSPILSKIRFGELEVGDRFVFNGCWLVKTGEYSAESDKKRGKANYLFFKKDVVKRIKFISLGDLVTSYTNPVDTSYTSYVITEGDSLTVHWKCIKNTGEFVFDAEINSKERITFLNSSSDVLKKTPLIQDQGAEKKVVPHRGAHLIGWVIPIPNLIIKSERFQVELTNCSVALGQMFVSIQSDQYENIFDVHLTPGDSVTIVFKNLDSYEIINNVENTDASE